MKKRIFLNLVFIFSILWIITTFAIGIISCSEYDIDENYIKWEREREEGIIDYNLQSNFHEWYNNLTIADWNYDENGKLKNYYCYSEQQAIFMYANQRGYYWNEYLHKNKIPPNQKVNLNFGGLNNPLEIRGSDYQYVVSALNNLYARWPYENYKVYHGVEYQEIEFWEQLKPYIKLINDRYDYSECIGKIITSYGFISTSLDRVEALRYCDGSNWIDNKKVLPLKEQVLFVINIPKDIIGAVYLGNFKFMGVANTDNQVLINKNSSFKINDIKWTRNDKKEKINIFYVDLISINNIY